MPIEPPPCPWLLPPPAAAGEYDVAGIGGDLEPGTVLAAYRAGLFPMHSEGELAWWSPVERAVLPLDGMRVTRSLKQSVRRFEVTVDTAFELVLSACGDPNRDGRWINAEIATAYAELHRLGWAHSVETWSPDGDLVGGLYGVAIGGLFAGESMFHRSRDASKVALLHLVETLSEAGIDGRVLDVQWATDHLTSMGAQVIGREEYGRRLATALTLKLPRRLDDGR